MLLNTQYTQRHECLSSLITSTISPKWKPISEVFGLIHIYFLWHLTGIAFVTMFHLTQIYDMFHATNKTKSYIPPVHDLK